MVRHGKKFVDRLEKTAERIFTEFLRDEDWSDSTSYLYYRIMLLEDEVAKLKQVKLFIDGREIKDE